MSELCEICELHMAGRVEMLPGNDHAAYCCEACRAAITPRPPFPWRSLFALGACVLAIVGYMSTFVWVALR